MKPTLLLVEPHAKLRATLSEAIDRTTGLQVLAFATVGEAMAAQAPQELELLLVGSHHGDDDALRLVRSLKNSWPNRPVICLSTTEDVDAARSAGCDDVLEQPFGLEELRGRLEGWIRKMGHAS